MKTLKPGGVAFYSDGVNTTETHSSKCQHCGRFTEFPSMRVMYEHIDICRSCWGHICLRPECRVCTPLIKQIEEQEEAHYRSQQLRKVL